MKIIRLSLSKLIVNPGGSLLSILLFALGIAIMLLLVQLEKSARDGFVRNLGGIDLVAGAKGSPMQLILSTVFHADAPTGNITLAEAERLAAHPLVDKAIPIALGDNYRGYRIVGTTKAYADTYEAALDGGSWFSDAFEAVIGYDVARSTGLQTGDVFTSIHGFHLSGHQHDDEYIVTGLMRKTGTVMDRLILTPVESVWLAHEHHDHHGEENHHHHDECDHDHHHEDCAHDHKHEHEKDIYDKQIAAIQKRIDAGMDISATEMELYNQYHKLLAATHDGGREITALLVKYLSPLSAVQLPRLINEHTGMQAAVPAVELNRLLRLVGYGTELLSLLAWLIILVSGINIFIHLLHILGNSMHEVALIRTLGGSKLKVFSILIVQGLAIAFSGWLAGIILSRVIWLFIPALGGFQPDWLWLPGISEVMLLVYSLAIGIIASVIPAVRAYGMEVHHILTQKS